MTLRNCRYAIHRAHHPSPDINGKRTNLTSAEKRNVLRSGTTAALRFPFCLLDEAEDRAGCYVSSGLMHIQVDPYYARWFVFHILEHELAHYVDSMGKGFQGVTEGWVEACRAGRTDIVAESTIKRFSREMPKAEAALVAWEKEIEERIRNLVAWNAPQVVIEHAKQLSKFREKQKDIFLKAVVREVVAEEADARGYLWSAAVLGYRRLAMMLAALPPSIADLQYVLNYVHDLGPDLEEMFASGDLFYKARVRKLRDVFMHRLIDVLLLAQPALDVDCTERPNKYTIDYKERYAYFGGVTHAALERLKGLLLTTIARVQQGQDFYIVTKDLLSDAKGSLEFGPLAVFRLFRLLEDITMLRAEEASKAALVQMAKNPPLFENLLRHRLWSFIAIEDRLQGSDGKLLLHTMWADVDKQHPKKLLFEDPLRKVFLEVRGTGESR